MKEIEEKLKQFEKKYSLVELTLKMGRDTLTNHFSESPEECAFYFPGEMADSVVFQLNKQHFIFNSGTEQFSVVSTMYSLFSGNDQQKKNEIGYYTLDVDEDGNVIEERLVFH
jgi:hypothetical protein